MVFDPFGDFATAGYLRNVVREKDLDLIKKAEHQLFRAQLPTALEYIARPQQIQYAHFLEVHRILFGGLYPWAGKDRAETFPDRAVLRGSVFFADPRMCRRAIDHGLELAARPGGMRRQPGAIMGMFAFGHPFLDGNGRTILLVHAELCYRAGFSINWNRTHKSQYLQALTREIEDPHGGHLDAYLHPFVEARIPRGQWLASVHDLPGLEGATDIVDTSAAYADPDVTDNYREFERKRGYRLD